MEFCFDPNSIKFVFLTFKESLFNLNQVFILSRSELTVDTRLEILRPEKNKFVSSANIIGVTSLETLTISFIGVIFIIKSRGPRIDPWGTPQVIGRVEDLTLASCTKWFLFER